MRTARKIGFVVVLLLLILGALTFLLAHFHEPDLMRIAEHLPYGPGDSGDPNAYYWLTDSDLMYLSSNLKAGTNVVERINARTGKGETLGQTKSESLRLSPNGKWALTVTPAQGSDIYFIERTDGKRQLRYWSGTSQSHYDVAWTANDTKMVLSVSTTDGARLLTYPLDKLAPISSVGAADLFNTFCLGILPHKHDLAVSAASCDPIRDSRKSTRINASHQKWK